MTPDRSTLNRSLAFLACALVLLTAQTAFAQGTQLTPINNVTEFLQNFLTGPLARSAAIIGIAVTGYLFYAGRIAMGTAAGVIGGIAMVFGAGQIVDILSAIARGS